MRDDGTRHIAVDVDPGIIKGDTGQVLQVVDVIVADDVIRRLSYCLVKLRARIGFGGAAMHADRPGVAVLHLESVNDDVVSSDDRRAVMTGHRTAVEDGSVNAIRRV